MRRSVACVWPALTLSLSLSPRITRCLNACSSARHPLTRRSNILFERATPAYALLERLFERALARASACASLHIEGLPAAGAAEPRDRSYVDHGRAWRREDGSRLRAHGDPAGGGGGLYARLPLEYDHVLSAEALIDTRSVVEVLEVPKR